MKKRMIAALLVAVFGISTFTTTLASTINDAENTKQEAQDNLDNVNDKINEIESQQAELQNEINQVNAELVDLLVSIEVLKEEKSAKEKELKQVKKDLKKAKATEKKQYADMKLRIQYMYENGDTSFFEALLESNSIADVLNQIEYYDQVYTYDRDLLEKYETARKETAQLKVEVEQAISDLEEIQEQYEVEQARLEDVKASLKAQNADFANQLAEAESLAAQYKATIVAQNEIIRQEEERRRREEEERRQREEEERRRQEAEAAQNNSNSGDNSSNSGSSSSSDSGKNPSYSTSVSGDEVVAYALKFLGKPYVWGGTDPNTGADCSGFTQYVMRHFGIYIPRTSGEQRYAGKEVSYSNAKPGDIICYAGHVAIYMGNGQIVHARGRAYGICTSPNAAYRTILSVRRVL